MFQIRTSCPSNNKYYIRQVNGGYNGAIQGKPTKADANVLANCVGYANGRFAEIQGENRCKYQFVSNPGGFLNIAKNNGLEISNIPVAGGILVWTKGNTDAGHVAIVERVDNNNQIYTSESCYNGSAFYNATRTNNNGRWGISSSYTYRGCIVNPSVQPEPTPQPTPTYKYKVGDVVTINGVYTNSQSTNKLVPAVKTGTITKIVSGARNPYLLNNGDIGWTNDECIVSTPQPTTDYKIGNVVVINGVYTSSTSTNKLVPAVKEGTITKILSGARNPYLLNNGNIGWVNNECIVGKK